MRRTAEDVGVARDLVRDVEIHRCRQCGACASVCPSQARGGIRPAELMARASLGAVDVRKEGSVWPCAACMSCSERCPFCFVQLDLKQKDGLPVLHLSELLDLAFGAEPSKMGMQYRRNKLTPAR